ncbi:hypothetical protein BDB00DRAFT_867795 [Zychaea mexicana]|uniref:uncharacterized protein n=1 Tax=Zychaea mexicana TaxID=64656 RepID=UPI0022FEF6C2|nr:uncharacterized protein BDB00DRAFT_867795 [Zychaea mexicana]KAI9498142.1 hypothetical protein BDB00DRAFT_867795 [Zychaea mexicana]
MVSKHRESTQAHIDAIAILEAEAQKRIVEIRQQVEFMCTALRAQGNTQINGLNLAIRRLTMREFCHEYGANNITIFQQLAKARLAQARKRTRDEMETEEEESAAPAAAVAAAVAHKPLPRRRQRQQQQPSEQSPVKPEEPSRSPVKQVKRVLPQRAVKGKNSNQVVKRVRVEQPKDASLEEEEKEDNHTSKIEVTEIDKVTQETQRTNTAESSTTEAAAQSEEEEEFGPLFVHLERPNHPRVGLQLDPQRTADDLGHFTVHMPDEVFGRMNQTQRNRLSSQIQDIQDQLDKVKSHLRPK